MTTPTPVSHSLLDVMKDGKEFESLISHNYENLNIVSEIRRSIKEIEDARKRPAICYIANVVRGMDNISIETSDELPFAEMVASIPSEEEEVDVILVTPGGLATTVGNFVNALRPRFKRVSFILLNMAMSAGTIFIMSGDEIVMSKHSRFGPIDPQIPNRDGRFVPAQSILLALNEIRVRGEERLKKGLNPLWTDVQLLRNIDPRDIGVAQSASRYSIDMVSEFLRKYKFRGWTSHSTDGSIVTDEEREKRAFEIAHLLCDHSVWKNHGHAINRETAHDICKLQITHSELNPNLDRSMRRMWAMFHWLFENTTIVKLFVSDNYCIIKNVPTPSSK